MTDFFKRLLVSIALFGGVAVGLTAAAVYQPRIVELLIPELPRMIVPAAMGIAILWRTGVLERRMNGRIEELKSGFVAIGKQEGMERAIELAREDRKEFKEALLTPVVPLSPVDPPIKK